MPGAFIRSFTVVALFSAAAVTVAVVVAG